jgi:hypothetical protein
MRELHWCLITTDRGGLVRGNVHELEAKRGDTPRRVGGGDEDAALADFSDAEQEVLLDALAIVANHFGADPRVIEEPEEVPPARTRASPARRSAPKSTKRSRGRR